MFNHRIAQRGAFFDIPEYTIPRLKILDQMVSAFQAQGGFPDLSKTAVIGVQHLLETTVTLFDAIIALGVKPENMFFSGKCYSTAPEIEKQAKKRGMFIMPGDIPRRPGEYQETAEEGLKKLWDTCLETIRGKDIEKIIILDDGFRCIETMPKTVPLYYTMAAIEQTRAGLYSPRANHLFFPLVEVASSAVKKILEPPLIASATTAKTRKLLSDLHPNKETTVFGIIGNGAIGAALCRLLLSQGCCVVVYDENEQAFQNITAKDFYRVNNIADLISKSDIIFGCTGRDVTVDVDVLLLADTHKTLVSCTSEDKEFRTLLSSMLYKSPVYVNPLALIQGFSKSGKVVTVIAGGFPFNFDRTPWNVPAEDIAVTQGLLLGAFVQGVLFATKPVKDNLIVNQNGARLSLDPFIQNYVAQEWLKTQPEARYSEKTRRFFDDVRWIQTNSGGIYCQNAMLHKCFGGSVPIETPDQNLSPRAKL